MRTRTWIAVVVGIPLLVALAAARTAVGHVAGRVSNIAGVPMPGVAVTLVGADRPRVITNASGEYAFSSVAPGSYRVTFEAVGYRTLVQPAQVSAGGTVRLDVRLEVDPNAPPPGIDRPGAAKIDTKSLRVEAGDSNETSAPAAQLPSTFVAAGGVRTMTAYEGIPRYSGPFNTESYSNIEEHAFRRTANDPLSTFSIDVDTASYANMRRFLNNGTMPPAGAVRIEELINYFRFDYQQPAGDAPFSITTELAACPWNPKHRLALIGLQGRALPETDERGRNLVFLIDVSGSMASSDKLPLVRTALRMLAGTLHARDRVAIVVYAGASGLVLPSTPGDRKHVIQNAIAELESGGSTNGGEGIKLAYRVAREHFIRGGINRVVLATDGDFNVGVTSEDELVRLIEQQRASGVFLSVLGVGTGNLKDSTMEKLADKGNGNYSYLDSLAEARKVLVQEAGGTLVTVAKDVKIQVEFNPRAVGAYRLIGYENRVLQHQEFNDDTKDAGEIGAGHSMTALYEIVPAGVDVDVTSVDPLKYQNTPQLTSASASDELFTVKLRYKQPDGDASKLLSAVVRNQVRELGPNLGFASAVAEFGMLVRGSKNAGNATYAAAIARARAFRGADPEGYRTEFVGLAELAASLARTETTQR
jgi:Ca-activated chloride channel homolog